MRGVRVTSVLLLVAAFAAVPMAVRSPYYLHLVILFLLWVGLGQAWNLLGGFTGQVSFGHAAFFGTGAYVASLLYVQADVPLLVGGALAGIVAAVLAVPIGFVCFRLRGPYFALTILGMAEILRLIATNWRSVTNGPVGVLFPPIFADKLPFYYIALALAVVTMAAVWLTLRSPLGFRLRAVRDDQEAAAALGIDPTRVKLASLMESAFLTGALGAFFAPYQGYIDPEIVFSIPDVSIAMVVVTVLGGMGHLWGPPVGAVVVVLLSEILRTTLGGAHLLVYAVVIVGIVLFVPEGLMGMIGRLGGLARRRAPAPAERPLAPPPAPATVDGHAARARDAREDRPLVRTERLTKQFGGLVALRSVTLEVPKGATLGLIGPNGAGKTTLLALVAGFERPTAGRIWLDGEEVTALPAHRRARHGIARTFQIVRPLAKMTVLDNVVTGALQAAPHLGAARDRACEVLQLVELYARRGVLASNLTLAERKRLELARALATRPRLLLLDEVAAGLNATETRVLVGILDRVRALGITIVAVEHVMQVIMSISDRIVVLNHGEVLADGAPADVARDPEVVRAYLGDPEVTLHA